MIAHHSLLILLLLRDLGHGERNTLWYGHGLGYGGLMPKMVLDIDDGHGLLVLVAVEWVIIATINSCIISSTIFGSNGKLWYFGFLLRRP